MTRLKPLSGTIGHIRGKGNIALGQSILWVEEGLEYQAPEQGESMAIIAPRGVAGEVFIGELPEDDWRDDIK